MSLLTDQSLADQRRQTNKYLKSFVYLRPEEFGFSLKDFLD